MRNEPLARAGRFTVPGYVARQALIGSLLILALFAFEIFNFDTTRYALSDLLGSVSFGGVRWASILAIALCAIDFAGLARLFSPEREGETWGDSWYLMAAWLLGATMNAVMTWWAVNLTLLNHSFGNEVLSREQLLQVVPPFVAVLVWVTRILFIGAFSIAGEHLFGDRAVDAPPVRRPVVHQPTRARMPQLESRKVSVANRMAPQVIREDIPDAEPVPSRRMQRPPLPSMLSARTQWQDVPSSRRSF